MEEEDEESEKKEKPEESSEEQESGTDSTESHPLPPSLAEDVLIGGLNGIGWRSLSLLLRLSEDAVLERSRLLRRSSQLRRMGSFSEFGVTLLGWPSS